jgi:hypothetical protein
MTNMHDFTNLHTRHNATGQPVENHKPLSTSAARIRAAREARFWAFILDRSDCQPDIGDFWPVRNTKEWLATSPKGAATAAVRSICEDESWFPDCCQVDIWDTHYDRVTRWLVTIQVACRYDATRTVEGIVTP